MIACEQVFNLLLDMATKDVRSGWVDCGLKRTVDICGVIIASPFLLGLLVVLMVLIVCIDKTYPLFSQMRVGKNGVPFRFYKLNTMGSHRSMDISRGANDDRATRLGKILRLTILDEVPQILINVLLGDMALVGPRPLLQTDIDLMKQRLSADDYEKWYRVYTAGRPGWTGKFGLSSRRFKIQSHSYLMARMHHDISYRQTATWWMDVKIVFIHAALPFIVARNHNE
ncbi:MAG TPA: sugar transferase [Candidatus Saccharimonadales bacterium]|nr:sugar transferase [Candidatus Saccharimonadales bacterium]